MPPRKKDVPVIGSANALAELERRNAAIGAMIKLRATQRGYYGRPTADIVEPGTVFRFAVKDLEPVGATPPKADRQTIRHGGVLYLIPRWCEDPATPVAVPDEDEDDEETDQEPSLNDDVI